MTANEGNMNLLLVALVMASYWIVSTTLVFVNKQLVNSTPTQKDLTIFIVWFQFAFGAFFLFLVSTLCIKCNWGWHEISSIHLERKQLLRWDMLLSSLAFAASLFFNSLLLKYISVSFYQIARSLTIIFVISLSAVLLHEKVTFRFLLACALIVSGFYIGAHEELLNYGVQIRGVLYGVVTSFFSAFSSTVCKQYQRNYSISSLQFTYSVFTVGFIFLTPIVCLTSELQFVIWAPWDISQAFWCQIVLAALCCLLVGWISTLQITLTSPLTYIISTNTKSVLQTVLAIIWNNETRSLLWWLGNILVLSGIALYAVFSLKKQSTKLEMIIKDSMYEEQKTFQLQKNKIK